jgi:sugar lactone lactonase YvrE
MPLLLTVPQLDNVKKIYNMTKSEVSSRPKTVASGSSKATVGRLFVLDLSGGRILSVNTDGSDLKTIVTDCRHPDGIVVDIEARHIYWTDMGVPNLDDGCIERADLDGGNRTIIIPEGGTFTPKQLYLDKKNGKLYWCDREGMRVMCSNLNGSNIETLVQTGHTDSDRRDATKWCVGITVDVEHKQMYWTQKGPDKAGKGRIFRASTEIANGQSAANRTDIEVLFDGLPEPIDLDLDLNRRMLYWTDRGDPPSGNTVNRALMDIDLNKRQAPEILLRHLMEGIGIALDLKGERMFLTDLAGSVYSANLNGSDKNTLLELQGNLTGVAYAELHSEFV